MKIGTFRVATPLGAMTRAGVLADDGRLVDATAARTALLACGMPGEAAARIAAAQTPPDVLTLLKTGPAALDWIREAIEYVAGSGADVTPTGARIAYELDEVELLSPLPRPAGLFCFATWPSHIEDSAGKGFAVRFPSDESGILSFYKGNPDSVGASGSTLRAPSYSPDIDFECEMGVITFDTPANISPEEAPEFIAGYCVFNDVSTRTRQAEEMNLGLGPTKGKDFNGSNVLGPWLVSADEVGDPQKLRMAIRVNGEEWNSYSTAEMHWPFTKMVSFLATEQNLSAGSVLTSGCFPGGSALDSNRKLEAGDAVELEIERLGVLKHTIGA